MLLEQSCHSPFLCLESQLLLHIEWKGGVLCHHGDARVLALNVHEVCCRGKTNFFERRVGEYQKSGVMAGLKGGMNAHEFTTDADF